MSNEGWFYVLNSLGRFMSMHLSLRKIAVFLMNQFYHSLLFLYSFAAIYLHSLIMMCFIISSLFPHSLHCPTFYLHSSYVVVLWSHANVDLDVSTSSCLLKFQSNCLFPIYEFLLCLPDFCSFSCSFVNFLFSASYILRGPWSRSRRNPWCDPSTPSSFNIQSVDNVSKMSRLMQKN